MARRPHVYSRPAREAATVLGLQIAAARRERRWTAAELAQRAGISVNTLRSAERGEPTVAVGVVFELATLLGVPLFAAAPGELSSLADRQRDRLALLPAHVRSRREPVDDNF
ncbi:MAG: helix-turn-helix domain-containing protein [Streptosporangiaceae bacterium]